MHSHKNNACRFITFCCRSHNVTFPPVHSKISFYTWPFWYFASACICLQCCKTTKRLNVRVKTFFPFTFSSTYYLTLILLCRNAYAASNKVHFVEAEHYQKTTTHSGLISDLILVRLWTTSTHWCHMTCTSIASLAALSGLFNIPIFAVGSNINPYHTQQNSNYEKASGHQTGTIKSSVNTMRQGNCLRSLRWIAGALDMM